MTQIKKNFIWNTIGNLAYLASQWLITILITRFYGYADAGILSLAMSITATFQTVALFGIRNYQVSDIDKKYSDNCYVMFRNITCAAAFILCMCFTFINDYSTNQIASIFWFMLFRLAECFSDVVYGIAQRNGRLDIAGKGFALKAAVILLSLLLCRFAGGNLNQCIMLMALFSWCTSVIFDLLVTRKLFPFKILHNFTDCLSLGKETFLLCVYLFLSASVTTIPKYLLELMTDEETLGAYSSIFAPALIIQAAMGYIYTPFVGKFAELYGQKRLKDFLKMSAKIVFALLIIGALALVAAIFLGDFALEIIFGHTILAYTYLLIPIIFSTIIIAVASFAYMLEIVIRDFKNLIIGCVIGAVCSAVSAIVMIDLIGANGTSVGMFIGEAISVIYMAASLILNFRRKAELSTPHINK